MSAFLDGRRILILEDEYFAALDVQDFVEGHGGTVLGPVGRLDAARTLARDHAPDGAILDVHLDGSTSYPLASELLAAGVVVVFLTGYEVSSIAPGFAHVPRLSKPLDHNRGERTLRGAFGLD